jgi:NSS family neurotransmitter:Na+ symporter
MQRVVGKNWFDLVIDTVADLMLPVGGLGFAIFVAWRLGEVKRRAQFPPGIASAAYLGWLMVLRWFVPLAVGAVFLHAIGLI